MEKHQCQFCNTHGRINELRRVEVLRVARDRNATLTYNCEVCAFAYRDAMARVLPFPIAEFVYKLAQQGRKPWSPVGYSQHVKFCGQKWSIKHYFKKQRLN